MIITVLYLPATGECFDQYHPDEIKASMSMVSFEYSASSGMKRIPPYPLIKTYLPAISHPMWLICDGRLHKFESTHITHIEHSIIESADPAA